MNVNLEKERKVELRAVVSFIVILAIIIGVVLGVIVMVMNKRIAKEEEKERIIPSIEIAEVSKGDFKVKMPLPQNLWVGTGIRVPRSGARLLEGVHNGPVREWVCNSSEKRAVVGNFLFGSKAS